MKFILLLIAFYSWSALAQKNLSSQTFQASIRPVLNGVLHDYYQMIGHFPDFPKELPALINQVNALHEDKELMLAKCPRLLAAPCLSNIQSLQTKLSAIEAKTLVIISELKMPATLHISSIAGLRILGDFQNQVMAVKGDLSNSALTIRANVKHRRESYQIVKRLDELSTLLSLSIIEYVPFAYKEDFRQVFFNFIQPIQTQISKAQNYEFFNKNIVSLNFSFNLLNMTLTKRKKTPEGMAPYLSLIHNRWNSILRYYY